MNMTKKAKDLRTGDKVGLFGFVCTVKSVSPDPKDPSNVVRIQFGDDVAVAGSGSGELFYNCETVVTLA
jgi:hypothetical protein